MATDAPIAGEGSIEPRAGGERAAVVAALALLTIGSWAYLVVDAAQMSRGRSCCQLVAFPQTDGWPLRSLAALFVMWAIMMIAMMTPTAAPMVLMFSAVNRQRRAMGRPHVATAVFLGGYLLVWTAFSAAATFLQWGLHSASLVSPAMVSTSPLLGGTLLIAAGVFQFTPLKHACLRRCRSPLDFILTEWREGTRGALIMGLRQGLFCTTCCWLLMALLFVLGVMNLLWVGLLTVFVLVEKVAPFPRPIARLAGVACIVWGVMLFVIGHSR